MHQHDDFVIMHQHDDFSLQTSSLIQANVTSNSNNLTEHQLIEQMLKNHSYSIFLMNTQSLRKNLELFKQAVADIQTSFLCVTEIWGAQASLSKVHNYHEPIFRNRKGIGGGVGIYIHTSFTTYKEMPEISNLKCKVIEVVAVEVTLEHSSFIVATAYRPPGTSIPNSLRDLESILNKLSMTGKKFILNGDFNIDISKPSSLKDQYLDILQTFQCFQWVNVPTRITSKSATNIDHIISNFIGIKVETTSQPVADHLGVVAAWKYNNKHDRAKNCSVNHKQTVDINASITNLREIDWNSWQEKTTGQPIDDVYKDFYSLINENLVFKKKRTNQKQPEQPWMTYKLLSQRQEVLKAKKKFLKSKKVTDEIIYKTTHSIYKDDIQKAKDEYFETKIKAAGKNGKLIWKVINEGLQRNQKDDDLPQKMVYLGQEYTSDDAIADMFNTFYKNFGMNLSSKINSNVSHRQVLEKTEAVTNKMSFQPTTPLQIYKIIKSLKNKTSCGFDNLSNKLLKAVAPTICLPISSMLNQSFQSETFPSLLKISKLQPIYKAKEKSDPSNWRQINQLSCISKIWEKVVTEQINDHLEHNNINSSLQFGFKKAHSTVHPIILARNLIESAKNKSLYTIVVNIDLKAAFDLIRSSSILLEKYEHYGLEGSALNWLKSFFTGRQQYVTWKSSKSQITNLFDLSVVQGSSIGPGAFNCYVSDMPNASNFSCFQFCDDTQLFLSHENLETLITLANTELQKILDYMESNKLLVSKNKCNYQIHTPKPRERIPNTVVKLGEEEIERVSESKFLGIIIDDKLKFTSQIEKVEKKLRSAIGALSMVKKTFNYRAKMAIFHSFIESYINYGFIAWGDKINKTKMKSLLTLQKKALRLVFNAKYNAHSSKLFALSGIIPVDEKFHHESLLFIKKKELGKQPKAFDQIIEFGTESKLRSNTENKIKLTKFKKGNVMYSMIYEWNNCDPQLRNSQSLNQLKNKLKEMSKSKMSSKKCSTRKCYFCQRDRNVNYESYMGRKK